MLLIFVVLSVILSPFSDVGIRTACSIQQHSGDVCVFFPINPKVVFAFLPDTKY